MDYNIIIVNKLAENLLPIFYDLDEFNIIYTENELQNSLLDEIAPNFFWGLLNEMFFDRFFLAICRMLDPVRTGNFENLTLLQLVEIANNTNYSETVSLKERIIQIKEDSSDILILRRKFIAHRDLNHSIKDDLIITRIEFDKIKDILSRMSRCIQEIQNHLGIEQTSFVYSRDIYGATALLRCLRHGMVYMDTLRNREDLSVEYYEKKNSRYGQLDL